MAQGVEIGLLVVLFAIAVDQTRINPGVASRRRGAARVGTGSGAGIRPSAERTLTQSTVLSSGRTDGRHTRDSGPGSCRLGRGRRTHRVSATPAVQALLRASAQVALGRDVLAAVCRRIATISPPATMTAPSVVPAPMPASDHRKGLEPSITA